MDDWRLGKSLMHRPLTQASPFSTLRMSAEAQAKLTKLRALADLEQVAVQGNKCAGAQRFRLDRTAGAGEAAKAGGLTPLTPEEYLAREDDHATRIDHMGWLGRA